jgi:hypothetical protein
MVKVYESFFISIWSNYVVLENVFVFRSQIKKDKDLLNSLLKHRFFKPNRKKDVSFAEPLTLSAFSKKSDYKYRKY